MGISPQPGSPAAAPIAMSVAMRKYHCRLFRSWRYDPPRIVLWTNISRSAPLMLSFLQTDNLSAGGLGVFSNAAFAHHA